MVKKWYGSGFFWSFRVSKWVSKWGQNGPRTRFWGYPEKGVFLGYFRGFGNIGFLGYFWGISMID